MEVGSGLLSHGVASALPSTLVDFTAGFGMGPGVSPPLLPPTPYPLLAGIALLCTGQLGTASVGHSCCAWCIWHAKNQTG